MFLQWKQVCPVTHSKSSNDKFCLAACVTNQPLKLKSKYYNSKPVNLVEFVYERKTLILTLLSMELERPPIQRTV